MTPVFHPTVTRNRPVLLRMSVGEATGRVNPARCCSSLAANAAGAAVPAHTNATAGLNRPGFAGGLSS